MSIKLKDGRTYSVDQASYDLAKHFSDGEGMTEDELKDLAQDIQDAVENWFGYRASQRGK